MNKKLKELKEQKNSCIDRVEELVNLAEQENRTFSSEEEKEFNTLIEKTKSLQTEIEKIEEIRVKSESIKNMEGEVKMGVNKDNVKDRELRGLELYLRKEDGEELRDLQVTTNGTAIIPENVANTVITKIEETSPVFAKARKFPSVAGTLKIARETALSLAGFVGEGTNISELGFNLEDVKLTQKRVGAAISLSNQLINDSAIDIVNYSINLLARRVAKAIEKSILVGSTDDEFNGIVNDDSIAKVTASGAITIDTLMDVMNSVNPAFLTDALWIVQRKCFNQIAKLKDDMGHYYMQNGVVNGKLTYTLFGIEVVVTDSLTDTTPIVFGSIIDSYAVMIKKGLTLQHVIGDTTQALRGSQLLVLDGYMDGAVYNSQGLAILTVGA